ncbi:MAG: DUF5132 domain-containing protein [Gammaproteobacteria bacterium]|jgi:hypothetical protein|nr:DUF5132 domain-containing protein [Gammaproteobacteria bacterium]
MSIVDNFLKGDTGKGVAIGIGIAILTPVAIAVLSGAARPVARAALKSGILFYEKGREKVAELGEAMEDLAAEARAEMEQGHAAEAAEAGAGFETGQAAEETEAEVEAGENGDK